MNQIDQALAGKLGKTLPVKKVAKKPIQQERSKLTDKQFAKEHPFFTVARLLDPQGRIADAFVKESDKNKINAS